MSRKRDQGFTIIELLVALAVASILMVAISAIFTRTVRLYTLENAKSALQQEMRAALEIIARDVRMAAYNPRQKKNRFGIKTATATRLHFTSDLDENGVVDPSPSFPDCEVLSYRFDGVNKGVQIICGEGTGTIDPQTLIGGIDSSIDVTALDFSYRDNAGQPTTNRTLIRGVIITITADIPAGIAGRESRSYSTWVDMRNTAPNSYL
jgi:type IV pilus assembly protein PilW